ncbi:MAG: SDR family oxidoreductase [Planctomycetota bacterium]|jgi:NADP-dependent 3-hydroxy acid dehydrogenase YdfG
MSVLSDSVAIVTGASSGIGEATALALAERNTRVVLVGRRAERLAALARRIVAEGGHALSIACDVTQRAQVEQVVETTLQTFDRIDVLINNAGVMPLAPLAKCRFDEWDRTIDVNLKGALYAIGCVLPTMLKQGTGHIVNVSSVAGRRVFPNAAVYCATKFALHAISEALRGELAERAGRDGNSIRVTIVAPGVVDTELRDSIADAETRREVQSYYDSISDPLQSRDIAAAILTCLRAPAHVALNEILIRPTSQTR